MLPSMDFLTNPPIFMSVTTTILFLLLLLPLSWIYMMIRSKSKIYHPIGGTVLNQLINFKTIHDYLTDLSAKYKTYRILGPFRGEVFTSDPANVEYILKTNFENYGKGAYTHNTVKDLLGDGIFTVDGEKWRKQRKLASYEFSTKVLRDFSSVVFRKNAVKLGTILSQAANSNQVVDINDLFLKRTMDSIFKVGFGIDLDNMSAASEEGVRFCRAFDDANTLIVGRFFDIPWKIKKFFNIGSEAELKKSMKVIDDFVYKVIQIKIEQMHKLRDDLSFKKEDILSKFLQINDKDLKYSRDIVLNFVLAGKDPIAITMSWFIYMLCKYPQVQEKVAKEIKEKTNMKKDITNVMDFEACVSEDALEKMEYLHAALTETLRLYPALSWDVKICFADDVLPDGFKVKKGDMIIYLPYAMGRMNFIWGDDAQDFKPERWLDENGCFRSESPFRFTAFQAGPRTCLGRDFAYKQLKIFSSVLLGCFVFKMSDENKVPTYRTSINLHVDGPLEIRVFNRLGLHDT